MITIASKDGSTRATFIPERGGVGTSILMPGHGGPRELLFQGPDTGWVFCFPICGRLERQGQPNVYDYEGHWYELPIHGFARQRSWEVSDEGSDHLLLTLRDDESSRAVYPFHFTVELYYEIAHGRLSCRQTYTNHGDRPMPYYAGFHPYFATKQVTLNFAPVRRFRYHHNLTDIVGEQPLFALPVAGSNPEIHEQLLALGEDKEIHIRYPNKDTLILAAEGVEDPNLFPYVQIFTPAGQPFLCVEPWMGYPNAMNSVAGVRWLAPGQSEHGVLRLWIENE